MSDTPHPHTYDMVLGLRVHRRFLEKPIPDGEVEAILEAARWTGSSKNTQKWAFVVIDQHDGLERLATAGSFTRPIQAAALAIALVWPSDGYEFDIGRVAQNMMLAASSMGIGSCPVTLHDEDRAREVLGVPSDHRCRYVLAFGYPDESAAATERSERKAAGLGGRKPLSDIVSYGRFEPTDG